MINSGGSTTQRELLGKRLAIINFNVRGERERGIVGGARDDGVGRLAEPSSLWDQLLLGGVTAGGEHGAPRCLETTTAGQR